jgi:hypothetical protein
MIFNKIDKNNFRDYSELNLFQDIYLEDSYVLKIIYTGSEILFMMDFVLKENHPQYQTPKNGEKYYYKNGVLIFNDIKIFEFCLRNVVSIDLDGAVDIGNIDFLIWSGERYILTGDWGDLDLVCKKLLINWI